MEYVPSETALVIAGAWNAAILSPRWVQQYGLQRPGEIRVQMLFPAVGGFLDPPRFSFDDFSYMVRPEALVIAPSEGAVTNFDVWESTAANMLAVLQHTPITGLGHNFEFREPAPAGAVLGVFTAAREDIADVIPTGWEPGAIGITAAFANAARSVVMTAHRQFDAGQIVLKFNFHHPLTTWQAASDVLRGENGYHRMTQNLAVAQALVDQLYGDTRD